MIDKDIIKALERCKNYEDCNECPYIKCLTDKGCLGELLTDTLALINRQQAELTELKENHIPKVEAALKRANEIGRSVDLENEQLKAEIERLTSNLEAMAQTMPNMAKAEQAEAVKEFAERLKEKSFKTIRNYGLTKDVVEVCDIDNLVKEMIGE